VTSTTTTSPPAIDEWTAAAVQEALAAARQGRIGEAADIAERAIASGGEAITLNALLGMFKTDLGDYPGAVQNLEIAKEGRPGDVRITANLASALVSAGQFERALEVASMDLAKLDRSLQLARIRGYAAQMLGRPDDAIEAYVHVVTLAPEDWESWNNLGSARFLTGDVDGAIEAIERALSLSPDSPPARLNLARAHRDSGRLEEAERLLRKMAEDEPGDINPLIDLHDLLKVQVREEEIPEVIDRALQLEPDNIDLLVARGRNYGAMLDVRRSEAAFRAVLDRDPANADAFVGLATIYEHDQPDALEGLAERAALSGVEPNALSLVQAFAHRRAKRFSEGADALGQIDSEFEPARKAHLLGQMLDGLGEYDAAFAQFEAMNAVYCEDPSQPLVRAERNRARVRREMEAATPQWIASWQTPAVDHVGPSPVFLVGFPRSGTTLLDTFLMGHPDVIVMEERPVVNRLKNEAGGFEAIAALTADDVREAQRRYFEIAAEYADIGPGSLLVDKSPLLLNEAAFIHRVFPNTRFILALRHPADTVLSCYVSNFQLNNAMVNFLRMDAAAEYYDLVFRSWENARRILPLTVREIRYEDVVEDANAALRPLVAWLGLDWDDRMLDHTATATSRGLISTASYSQVTEPIYCRSVGRWENYRRHMEPVLPTLQPWATKFGYKI
jgi:tetratricopeptide (TPR) repeat protein